MPREVTREDAEEILAEERHRQLARILNEIKVTLASPKNDGLNKLIEKQVDALNSFVDAMSEITAPKNTVEAVPEKAVSAIVKMEAKINEVMKGQHAILEELKIMNQPQEWVFDIKRSNYTHWIERVTAHNYPNIKGQA